MKEIELPDGRIAEFPDEMDNAAISAVLAKQFPAPGSVKKETPAPAPAGVGAIPADQLLRQTMGPSDFTKAFASTPARIAKSAMQMVGAGDYVPDFINRKADEGKASTLGRIAGDIAGTGGIRSAGTGLANTLAKLNAAKGFAPTVGQMAEGATYGAAQGALTSPDEQADAALLGAVGGGAGAGLGRALGAIRQGAKPTEEALGFAGGRQPAPHGVRLTPGQLAPEGGWLRRLEEGIADVPFIGAPLRERNKETLSLYQDVSRMLAHPKFQPVNSIADLKKAFNTSYTEVLQGQRIGDVSAVGMHEMEKNLRREANLFIKSLDPEQQKLGFALKDKADEFGAMWRSQLPEESQKAISRIDRAYANFVPIKEASKRQNATLVNPENYTPAMVLKRTRALSDNDQAHVARQAERFIGSIPARSTTAGNIGLGGVGLGTLLNPAAAPYTVGGALAAAAYGTKAGQALARGAQRALTADELAYTLNALRRGAGPAAATVVGRSGDE